MDITNRFSSKHELYQYIDEHLVSDNSHHNDYFKLYNTVLIFICLQQFYILPEKHVTKDYMKAIIAGRKHLLGK